MRLWHLLGLVFTASVVLALARDPLSRVFLIVLTTGLGEVFLGLASVMTLFQTIGALGEARRLVDYAEALAATTVTLTLATALMSAWLFVGFWLVASFT
ncbi:MAG: hypothetical protein U0794_08755 [Isosphaeraceae bacterium]